MEAYGKSEGTDLCILKLSTIWRCVVSIMPWLIYAWEEIPGTPWIGQPRSLSECYGGKKYLLFLPAINQNFCFPAHSPVTTLTSPQTTSVHTLHFHEKNVHLQPLCKKYVSNLYFNSHPCSQSPQVVLTNSFCVQR